MSAAAASYAMGVEIVVTWGILPLVVVVPAEDSVGYKVPCTLANLNDSFGGWTASLYNFYCLHDVLIVEFPQRGQVYQRNFLMRLEMLELLSAYE